MRRSRTPPGVRELKRGRSSQRKLQRGSRTPPGVRELKLYSRLAPSLVLGRTPPGVRELKRQLQEADKAGLDVAPLPGCVN